MPPEVLQDLIAEARANGWGFFPPKFFSRKQIANWLAIDETTLSKWLRKSGIGAIPHWTGLLDIEVIAQSLVMRTIDDESESTR